MTQQSYIAKTLKDCTINGKNYECGIAYTYSIYVAKPLENPQPPALYVLLEYDPEKMIPMLTAFMEEGLIPYGMILFLISGTLHPTLPGGKERGTRANDFDQYSADYANFLVEELIPDACRIANESISEKPDLHFIAGHSSGGLAAWNAVWFRNDYFRRAFLSSPTFSAIRGGEEAMVIARKAETRPVRLYITTGTNEPDYYFGSSLYAAQNAASALEFAGYDFRFEQFNGEGHCCHKDDVVLWRRMMQFLWANWKTIPVLPLAQQIRIRNLVAEDSQWQEYTGSFPEKQKISAPGGVYTFEGGRIFFEKEEKKTVVADCFTSISAIGLSSDKWRLYIADEKRRFIFAMSILPDGSLTQLNKLAPLHLKHDLTKIGAFDMAVLADDRILAATELGIQGVVSFGITDLILPLPGDLPAEKVAVCGKVMYVASGDKIFYRELKIAGIDYNAPASAPCSPGYGDGFWYERSHYTCY